MRNWKAAGAALALAAMISACDNPKADVNVTNKEFYELPTGFWHSPAFGQIQINGTAEKGGSITINGAGGVQSGSWRLAGKSIMEIDLNGQKITVPYTRDGGLELKVEWPGRPPETWVEQ